MQIDTKTGEKHPVGYFSQKVPKEKKHLCSFDQEMNGITNACEFFRDYLRYKKFTIYTDHQPLIYQHRMKKPSPRLARLISKLGEFTFEIKHIKGEVNKMVDYLSRKDMEEQEDTVEFNYGEIKFKEGKKETNLTRGQKKKSRKIRKTTKNKKSRRNKTKTHIGET